MSPQELDGELFVNFVQPRPTDHVFAELSGGDGGGDGGNGVMVLWTAQHSVYTWDRKCVG